MRLKPERHGVVDAVHEFYRNKLLVLAFEPSLYDLVEGKGTLLW